MQKTPKLGLNKPDLNDYVNVADLNENMDVIDQFAQEVETQLSGVPDLETAVAELIQKVGSIQELSTANKLNLVSAINEVYQELTAHLADYVQQLGTAELATNDKTLKGAINEAFTLGNSRKTDLVDALLLLDESLPINAESTWSAILLSIKDVNTGLSYAAGSTKLGSTGALTVTGLSFKPTIVVAFQKNYPRIALGVSTNALGGVSDDMGVYRRASTYSQSSFTPNLTGFQLQIDSLSVNNDIHWIALEMGEW